MVLLVLLLLSFLLLLIVFHSSIISRLHFVRSHVSSLMWECARVCVCACVGGCACVRVGVSKWKWKWVRAEGKVIFFPPTAEAHQLKNGFSYKSPSCCENEGPFYEPLAPTASGCFKFWEPLPTPIKKCTWKIWTVVKWWAARARCANGKRSLKLLIGFSIIYLTLC